jgi:iron complex outermembrane receptor protein
MNLSTFAIPASLALLALQAVAQTAAPSLRPVVVTPMPGVAQDAFHAPASVDVLDAGQLRSAGPQVNLSESLVRLPGVVALNRQNYAQDLQVSIRGFGARSTFGVRGLRLVADGIPATMPDGQGQVSHFDLGTADRIEVLRGPFSALHGNSSGGVIRIVTADGGPGQVAELGTSFGSDGLQRQHLRLAGEHGPWNWNLGASHFATDGWRDHSAARRDGFNGKLKLQASAATRLTLVLNAIAMPDAQDPLGLTRAELAANPRQASPAAQQFDTRKSAQQAQVGFILDHRFDGAHALKLTTWRGQRSTEQFQAIPVAAQAPATHPGGVIALDRDYQGLDAQWIARTRLAGGPLTVTAGVMADELREHRRGHQNFVGAALGVTGALRRDEHNRVRSFDPYAQAQWDSERVGLTAGLRHSVVRFAASDRYLAPGNGDDSGAARFRATTPVLGAVFHASETLNVYAAAGTGFETPTFTELSYRPNGQAGLNFDRRAARSRQWELGVKAEPLAHWRLNAALFQARTSDELAVLSNTGGRSTFQNVAATRRRGLELALAGRWGDGWSTQAALTLLDAAYRQSFLTCASAPCTTPSSLVPAGNRIPGVPRTSAYAELAWRHRPWGLETAVEMRHLGRIAVDDRNTDHAAASTLFAVRGSLLQQAGRWTLREFLRVDNVADRRHVGSVIVNEGNRRFFEPGPGRTWLLGVTAAHAL